MKVKVAIICIGTELTTGMKLDTNSQYLSQRLYDLGIEITSLINLPDEFNIIKNSLSQLMKINKIIIVTGGLGPTQDDITRDVVKKVLNLETKYSEKIFKNIKNRFKRQGYLHIPDINKFQAIIFKRSIVIPNSVGTAPGFIIEKKKNIICLLPGPPVELIPMFEKRVIPYFRKKFKIKHLHYVYRLAGMAESIAAEKLKIIDEKIRKYKGEVTILSKPNLIDIIVSSKYNIKKIKIITNEIKRIFRESIYSEKWESIYSIVADLLKKKKYSLSLSESCTGGLVSKTFTDMPGSSKYFKFGVTVYSNEAKMKILKLKKEILDQFGAVSEQTALEMLKGLKRLINTDISVSVTGIAGPSGGTKNKPVGLVYIGIRLYNEMKVFKFVFNGNRERIRNYILNKAFELLYRKLIN